mgnify:FL=1
MISMRFKAVLKERSTIAKAYENAKNSEKVIIKLQEDLAKAQAQLTEASQKAISNINSFFANLKNILEEREKHHRQRVLQQFESQNSFFKNFEEKLISQRQFVDDFCTDAEFSVSDSDLKLLSGTRDRIEKMIKATANVEPIPLNFHIQEMNKENELNHIWKLFNPLHQMKSPHKPLSIIPPNAQNMLLTPLQKTTPTARPEFTSKVFGTECLSKFIETPNIQKNQKITPTNSNNRTTNTKPIQKEK